MKRSKGGGNEIELSPFWTQLCTLNPCEAERLAFKQLGLGETLSNGCILVMAAPTSHPTHALRLRIRGKPGPLPTETPVVSVQSESLKADLTHNTLKPWDRKSLYNPSPDSLPTKKVRLHLEPALSLIPRVENGVSTSQS